MVSAYVLIKVKPGSDAKIKEEMEKWEEVKKVDIIYGEWDLIAQVEVDRFEKITEIVIKRLRRMPEVRATMTMLVAG